MLRKLKLGTRGSPLALWQANCTKDALLKGRDDLEIEIITISTRAETFSERPLETIGVGVFTKELDEATLRGDIALAVHSLKDIPSQLAAGLVLAAVLERESPFDALISSTGVKLDDLPSGAVIGTGSPRRKAQLLARRPDFEVVPMRGNVETRLRKLREHGLAGTILAYAGLVRLGREDVITHLLDADIMVPAVGQGAVAVTAREDDSQLRELLAGIDHRPTRLAVEAERGYLSELRGGCQVPAGALATLDGDRVSIEGVVASPDGATRLRGMRSGDAKEPVETGRGLARELLDRGGREILARLRDTQR